MIRNVKIQTVPRPKGTCTVFAAVDVTVREVNVLDVLAHVTPVPGELATEDALVLDHSVDHLLGQMIVQVVSS